MSVCTLGYPYPAASHPFRAHSWVWRRSLREDGTANELRPFRLFRKRQERLQRKAQLCSGSLSYPFTTWLSSG